MTLLPKNYEIPEDEGNYMRFKEGENKFRILGKPIVGEEAWNTIKGDDGNNKRTPLRFRPETQIPVSELDDPSNIKHFWAMPVWNYRAKKVQILEITQKTIMRVLMALDRDKEWGDFTKYDVSVIRSGKTMQDTEYNVVPSPPKPLDKEAKDAYENISINLEALYDGEDPFEFDIPDEIKDIV